MKDKKVMVTVGLPEAIVARIDRQANKETRTRSNLVTRVVTNYITEMEKADASSSQLTPA